MGSQKRRLFGFFCGALLGCVVVYQLLELRPPFDGPPILRPWQGPVLFVQDGPLAEDGSFERIRIIQDPGWKKPVRLTETLMETPQRKGSQVIKRQAFAGDYVWAMPKKAHSDCLNWIQQHGGQINTLTDTPPWQIYLDPSIDVVGQFLEAAQQIDWLQAWADPLPDPTL